jgi:phage baseplate assembly protein W
VTALGFPFAISAHGGVVVEDDGGDAHLHGEIVQVLFTTPGERVGLPEFGCGLLALVFEPANPVLAAAVEFAIGQALTRWLGDRLVVQDVDVAAEQEVVHVDVAYLRRPDLAARSVRIRFS